MSKRTLPVRTLARIAIAAVSLSSLAILSACGALGTGPAYERPAIDVPASIGMLQSASPSDSVDLLVWWKGFHDPVLDALLEEATHSSQDLAPAPDDAAGGQAGLPCSAVVRQQLLNPSGIAGLQTGQHFAR